MPAGPHFLNRGLLFLALANWCACDRPADAVHPDIVISPLGGSNDSTTDQVHVIGDLGQGLMTFQPNVTKAVARKSDLDALAALKARVRAPVESVPNVAPTEETLTWSESLAPDQPVNFTLLLPERQFSWERLRGVKGAERTAIIHERQADLVSAQQPVIAKLAALNGQNIAGRWLANQIDVALPARFAKTLASWPEVEQLEHDAPTTPLGDGYDGYDRRIAIHADRVRSHGFTGKTGDAASPGSPVRLGDVGTYLDQNNQDNKVPSSHPGFEAPTTLATRFYANQICAPTTQSCSADSAPTAPTHDTVVMGVMAGSIENGQDPCCSGTNTLQQNERSGIATAAQIEYFQAGAQTSTASAIAIQGAVNAGVDILNNSWGTGWVVTNPATDPSGLNEILQNAFAAGILVVFSAGDNNVDPSTFSGTCNVTYPSNRPDVLSVNGMNTEYTSMGGLQTNPTLLADAWSTSGCTIDVWNGTSYVAQYDNAIGAVAPGAVGLEYYWRSSTNYGYYGSGVGSSYAAPITAGAAGILRDAWQTYGYGIRPNTYLKTDLMMLTDGYAFTSYADGGTFRNAGGTSQFSGPGRLQLRTLGDFPSGGWQWSWGTLHVATGTDWTKTISADIQNYRFAMFWEESDLTKVADIDVRVDALDSTGSVCEYFVASQSDYSIINTIHIKRSDIPSCALPNGSLQLHVLGYAVPSSHDRQIFFSDLWDNESTY